MFNELLLADYLYQQEKLKPSTLGFPAGGTASSAQGSQPSTFRETYFLEQFLSQAMGGFGITRQAAIEQGAYDGVKSGKINGADDLDAMAKKIGSRYSIWFDKHDELKMEWIDVHHFYTQPMYYVNYVFANFLALKYYEMFRRDPKGFIPRYIAMVKNGFNAPPSLILNKYLGLSLQDPKLVSGAFAILDGKIKALEDLYAKQ
jgi:oligoendopeptidase F